MPIENKEICGRFHELFRTGNRDLTGAVLADDFAWRTPAFRRADASSPYRADRDGLIAFAEQLRAAFPDLRFAVTNTLSDGDRVVASWTFEGTHRGGLANLAATGRPVRVTGINSLLIRDGRVREMWHHWGEMEFLQQLEACELHIANRGLQIGGTSREVIL